ncbi:epoxide hydrolase family protein [Yinghuangia seranimata]|uniref:epoxide hydrolase family protein n=1 Tax=Yinghuangia seranimata TaxID=408067 RepID=UPI00248CDD56|nr:epoxide hydrolase family protein [Yinghuangia seranimata]MDI2125565.1 alpha/beta fold hydrolase [Yinghuangia seranimata]
MITPFRIDIPQADLDELHDRLARTRWPDELPDAGWDYGIPLARVKSLAEYWRTGYDWRKWEARLNELPQFTTEIDGQNIHFVHVRSEAPDALPVVLTHGWPGSFVEYMEVVEPLSREFHLVIPSIPGFAFSGPTRERGWDVDRVARAWAELMARLGYDRYGVHGGDFGAAISRSLAALKPDQVVVAAHFTYLPTPPPPGWTGELSDGDRERVEQIKAYMAKQPAARVVNSTVPQTLAYSLNDSPTGLLAWLTERITEWGDPDVPMSDDHLLTNVSLYWLTGTAGSAGRLHRESTTPPPGVTQPVGVSVFAHDITRSIRVFAERSFDIVHWAEFERGGHYAPLEIPEEYASDFAAFFRAYK